MTRKLLEEGEIPFTIESRILRELGERLVRQPEVALLELIKNAYDADATSCRVELDEDVLTVTDDGKGMTRDEFANAWMRIGTSSKERLDTTPKFGREVTGEKGLGRFAVRVLGSKLTLHTVAHDEKRGHPTILEAKFDWPKFDRNQDLGKLKVPYKLRKAADDAASGTTLSISRLRPTVSEMNWRRVRTGSIGVVSAVRSLLPHQTKPKGDADPGFQLVTEDEEGSEDLSKSLLSHFVLKASVKLDGDRLTIEIWQAGDDEPYLAVTETYENDISFLRGDVRFFPKRKGVFADSAVDGREAYGWVRTNSGVKVFDRGFQIQPYGEEGDDWLQLTEHAVRNERDPISSIAKKHFAMTKEVRADPALNWMLRLPEPAQVIGAILVRGKKARREGATGLIAAADREGFIDNEASAQLHDIVRSAMELIAVADRQLQQEEKNREAEEALRRSREETRASIEQIESDQRLEPAQRRRIVAMLVESQDRLERQEESSREREQKLEIMSLLGVVGGFMTHEFGTAIAELKETKRDLDRLAKKDSSFADQAKAFGEHIKKLESFVAYSQLYIRAAKTTPSKPYTARPRLTQVRKLFLEYAQARSIEIDVQTDKEVLAPLVPIALYNGIAQNLLTNALKAVTASSDTDGRTIVLRAWNESGRHRLQVSDTGIGIPAPMRELIFDPLFTTTDDRRDPLGSGMGLGLALVRRGAAAFGGKAALVDPPPGFKTSVEVSFPLKPKDTE